MATNPVQPPVPPTPHPADAHYDEMSGVYGFFRRHQKKLLYTAGFFTLLTFSITGPMMQLASELFSTARPVPTIVVNGKRVPVQVEDAEYGQLLASNPFALPLGVLPMVDPGEESKSQLSEVYALMRRVAIEEGIEVSMQEVDRAINHMRDLVKAESAAKLARDMRFGSLAQYRNVVAEAMRVGNWLRLQTLALDSSDARVMTYMTSDREKITLRVATFDEKKAEEALKAASPLSDDDLKKWLEGKNDREKMQMQAYDLPQVELRFGALLLAEGQFDPEQWKDVYLKDWTAADDQLQNLYNMERDHRFKLEGENNYKPFDDAAVKAELTRLLQAEHVMNQLIIALRQKQVEQLKPLNDEVARTQGEYGAAETSVGEASAKVATAELDLVAKEKELAAKPDDEALKAAVAKIKAELEAAKAEQFAAKEKLPALDAAQKAASQAVKDALAAFDFPAAFSELTKDKSGFVQKAMSGRRTAEELKDLDALGLDLGKWPLSMQGASLQSKGDLCFAAGRTSKAVLLYQATDAEPRPIKPWDKLKPLAEGAYWTELARKQGEEKKKVMQDALLRLAKEKIADRVAEIEGKKTARTDEKLAEWEKKTNDAIAAAQARLANLQPGTQAHTGWQQELTAQQAELARKEDVRAAFAAEVQKAIEVEIAAEAKKHYGAVLDAAAAEAGFTVAGFGPYSRELQREPRFDKNFDPTVVFLMRSQSTLKEGEATDVLQDFANRRYHVAVCTKVEPLQPTDVSRRDFESVRTGDGFNPFASQQASLAFRQAFTLKALEARFELQRPVGEQREDTTPAKPK